MWIPGEGDDFLARMDVRFVRWLRDGGVGGIYVCVCGCGIFCSFVIGGFSCEPGVVRGDEMSCLVDLVGLRSLFGLLMRVLFRDCGILMLLLC